MSDCIFCKIVSGEIASKKFYEDGAHIAFLDIFPAGRGHALVIPKSHHADMHSMSAAEYGALAHATKLVADLLHEKLASDGTTIMQMNREAGWQTVFHTHFHVIPRWADDLLRKPWEINPADENSLQEIERLLTE